MSEKILGYILLILGLVLVFISLINVYLVFTGKVKAFEIVNFNSISIDTSKIVDTGRSTGDELEIVPKEQINVTTNLVLHVVLLSFVSTIGFRIATLGSNLLRPIVVNMKERTLSSSN